MHDFKKEVPGKLILHGVVGSHAYGLNTPESDIDTAGVFMLPLSDILVLGVPKETINRNDGTDKEEDPDFTLHELRKYMNLAAKNNPTALEYLWLDEYLTMTEEGAFLVLMREQFLSQRVRATYAGYARQQLHRLKERGDFGSDLKKRQAKHARHLVRLVLQAKHILQEGEVRVKLTDFEVNLCRYMSDLAVEDPEYFAECAESMLNDLDEVKSDLPSHPNLDYLDSIYYTIRMDAHATT